MRGIHRGGLRARGYGRQGQASDEDRAQHAKDWPKDTIPTREKPPFNRDWRLPKGPF